ncbi:hypothetical protein CC86DRAFT_375333 [Ophiobolus disseminans]|uniref:Uncharacterized protein n=1 Tax=Ophiobolus disseminans TaxID=1469910 RepID=A0A6A6ZDH9_9PLEO|nr:hypothetical protein CC86DRAFT_375333 [Ophiobolus disseminans]
MPRYDMGSGKVDDRDTHWLAYRVSDALDEHITDIVSDFQNNASGWEGWLQVQLLHDFVELSQSAAAIARQTALFDSVWTEFLREEAYQHPEDDGLPESFRNFVPVDNSYITVEDVTFRRWKKLPEPRVKVQRADFAIRVEIDEELSESHYVELKCRSSKESSATFVGRVK